MDLIRRKQNNILLHRVNIGEKTISIPVAQLGNEGERTIVITAGVDGDEYTGIEAAYALIDLFSRQKIFYRLIIIPILNIPGFESGTSWNPIDHKYPKHIFPGKEKGSSSEKLMYWLSENFLKDADVWIDLHSGASTEVIDPFVQIWKSDKKELNKKIYSVVTNIKSNILVFSNGLNQTLVKRNCVYVRLESGHLGQRKKTDIRQHIDWVKQLLGEQSKKKNKKAVYQQVHEQVAQKEGIWVPMFFGKFVKKGIHLGEVKSLDGKKLQKVTAKENGVFLWRRESMFCKKGDSLYAYAYEAKKI